MEPDPAVFDRAAVLERLGGDEELFLEIRDLFLSDGPSMVGEVREAARAADAATLERCAHGLKGSLLSLGAARAADVALALEHAGREGALAEADALLARLDAEVDRLVRVLEDQRTDGGPVPG